MNKEQFKQELKLALDDPKSYFGVHKTKNPLTGEKTTAYNQSKLDNFFQAFSTHYLDADVAHLTQNFPVVKFKQLEEYDKYAVGKYDPKNTEISLNIDLFLKGCKSSTVFSGFLATLCHEHQHFKQNLYIDLKKNGRVEEAKTLEPMLGVSPETENNVSLEELEQNMLHPISGQSVKAHEMFMAYTSPDKYKQMRSRNILINEIGKRVGKRSPIEVAHYFHDPHEVDARERSVEVFGNKMSEISEGDPLIDKYNKRVCKALKKFNKAVLGIQPKKVLELFDEEKRNINTEKLLIFANKIDASLNKEKVDIKSINDQGSFKFDHKPSMTEVERQSFVMVLKERLSTLPEDEAEKLLETLKNSNCDYASQIANKLTSTPTVSKLSVSQIEEERESIEPSTPSQEPAYKITKNRSQEQALSEEEQQIDK